MKALKEEFIDNYINSENGVFMFSLNIKTNKIDIYISDCWWILNENITDNFELINEFPSDYSYRNQNQNHFNKLLPFVEKLKLKLKLEEKLKEKNIKIKGVKI